ncbi:hypothetical protein [Nitrococcus mobilis]|nr:hypothetical protein [Nitrococcus mobilis]
MIFTMAMAWADADHIEVSTAEHLTEIECGWLIGQPTYEGRFVEGDLPDDLYEMGGPWAVFHLDKRTLYTDAFGHFSLVYGHGRVATNPDLIPASDNATLVGLMDIPVPDNWYPFGLTPKNGVSRLLPNHYLDLNSWSQHRLWPKENPRGTITIDEAATIIGLVVRHNINAVSSKHPLQLPLTAGYDSRMLLACARDHVAQLQCHTHNAHPATGRLDVVTAPRLCKQQSIPHQTLKNVEAPQARKDEWLKRAGRSAAGASYNIAGSSFPYNGRTRLTGHGGEALRGYYYRSESRSYSLEPQDLLYVEQRLGCWAGVLRWGVAKPDMIFWPMAHRRVLEVMLRLPAEAKVRSAVHQRVIEREWPDLLTIPVNKWWEWQKVPGKGLRAASRAIYRVTQAYRNIRGARKA